MWRQSPGKHASTRINPIALQNPLAMLAMPYFMRLMENTTVTDYAGAEHDIPGNELPTIAANLHAKAKRAIKSGKARSFDRDIEKALGD